MGLLKIAGRGMMPEKQGEEPADSILLAKPRKVARKQEDGMTAQGKNGQWKSAQKEGGAKQERQAQDTTGRHGKIEATLAKAREYAQKYAEYCTAEKEQGGSLMWKIAKPLLGIFGMTGKSYLEKAKEECYLLADKIEYERELPQGEKNMLINRLAGVNGQNILKTIDTVVAKLAEHGIVEEGNCLPK